jgi:hypothetical protein
MLRLLRQLRDLWDWTHFFDALLATLQTKFGVSVGGGLLGMLLGAALHATWYEIALMGLFVFIAINVFSILRILRIPRSNLEILFDQSNVAYVRPIPDLYGDTGEFYAIGLNNRGNSTLYDVSLRALDSWFTQTIIAPSQLGGPRSWRSHDPVGIHEMAALHPKTPEIKQLFGLSFNPTSKESLDILNTIQRFTLEAIARDTAAVRREFEYNPHSRPMLKMLP